MKLIEKIASLIAARENCINAGNTEWLERHAESLRAIMVESLPSGSGFDSGTQIDLDASTSERVVFYTEYHHMTEGYYDGWTKHKVIARPSFVYGVDLRITGRDRNGIKDYIADVFLFALDEEYAEPQP